MISIPEAVRIAHEFAKTLYAQEDLKHLRVEEIESSEDGKQWFITLGWVEPGVRQVGGYSGLVNATLEPLPRVYKRFIIDAEDGHVVSMKMRD